MEARLTPRQQDVLSEVRKGKTNKEIARALGITDATVKLHMTEVFKAFNVTNRWEALAKIGVIPARPVELTDEEILREFTQVTFDAMNVSWPDRVLKFARCLIKRTRGD